MNNKFFWGIGVLFILLIVGATVFVLVKDRPGMRQLEKELEVLQKRMEDKKEDQSTPEDSQEEHPATGHFHEDGTFHEGVSSDPVQPPSRDYTPTQIQIPDGITDPEVIKAWERLDYIANNIWEWGGKASPRALEIMAELPDPQKVAENVDHCGEKEIELLDELSNLHDPRSVEFLVSYQLDSGIMGKPISEALVAMGPASLPSLIARLNEIDGKRPIYPVPQLLVRISETYQEEIGRIVQYIILP
ncbi:hypothetical protein F4083_10125, partial [Candidatus Poribacteria bacterium]|nr:hypothetical protein [Candidatus Poribacteria bacterium]